MAGGSLPFFMRGVVSAMPARELKPHADDPALLNALPLLLTRPSIGAKE